MIARPAPPLRPLLRPMLRPILTLLLAGGLMSCTEDKHLAPEAPASRPPASVKAPGNLPVRTQSELAAEEAARKACLDACADDACRDACMQKFPIMQVEVVPDLPAPPPR